MGLKLKLELREVLDMFGHCIVSANKADGRVGGICLYGFYPPGQANILSTLLIELDDVAISIPQRMVLQILFDFRECGIIRIIGRT